MDGMLWIMMMMDSDDDDDRRRRRRREGKISVEERDSWSMWTKDGGAY